MFNRKMYAVDFYFQLFLVPSSLEVVRCCQVEKIYFSESWISHSFSVYQVDRYFMLAHTSPCFTQTHTRATGIEKKHKEILFLPERGSGESRSTVFTWKYGRTSWTCVGSSLFLSVEGKHFLITLTPPKELSSFVPTLHRPTAASGNFRFSPGPEKQRFSVFSKNTCIAVLAHIIES